MKIGTCKLTGTAGVYVKAHLIPKALTQSAVRGSPFVQGSRGLRPVRRWSSWYDSRLVVREGEKILEAFDTWAINELRAHELVWSGWGSTPALSKNHSVIPGTAWGIRDVQGLDPRRLRLFFLSLLWRAAATTRSEFSDVILPPTHLEKLRLMLLAGDAEPLAFYPIQLIQLSTIGMIHNHTPIASTKHILALENQPERQIPIFRFYFDGLVAHVHRQVADSGYTESLGSLVVGACHTLTVSTVTYETSFQRDALNQAMAETRQPSR